MFLKKKKSAALSKLWVDGKPTKNKIVNVFYSI